MIIGLSGYAKSGKDEVAKEIVRLRPEFQIKRFSGKLKKIASILTGFNEDLFEDQQFKNKELGEEWSYLGMPMTVRRLLQRLGTEAIRDHLHQNAWVNALMACYRTEPFKDYMGDMRVDIPASNWVITDVRFPNEAKAIKDRGGIIVRVNRTGFGPVNGHPSETALDEYDFDKIIENNGTIADLKESAKILMS
jgi:hypothetical protein